MTNAEFVEAVKRMERDQRLFATILVSFSAAAGIGIGVGFPTFALPVSLIAAIVGSVAVHKFCKVPPVKEVNREVILEPSEHYQRIVSVYPTAAEERIANAVPLIHSSCWHSEP